MLSTPRPVLRAMFIYTEPIMHWLVHTRTTSVIYTEARAEGNVYLHRAYHALAGPYDDDMSQSHLKYTLCLDQNTHCLPLTRIHENIRTFNMIVSKATSNIYQVIRKSLTYRESNNLSDNFVKKIQCFC